MKNKSAYGKLPEIARFLLKISPIALVSFVLSCSSSTYVIEVIQTCPDQDQSKVVSLGGSAWSYNSNEKIIDANDDFIELISTNKEGEMAYGYILTSDFKVKSIKKLEKEYFTRKYLVKPKISGQTMLMVVYLPELSYRPLETVSTILSMNEDKYVYQLAVGDNYLNAPLRNEIRF